ncbi:hypothetical protein LEMLEM_LOCUS3942 [Lemmus lemmus]
MFASISCSLVYFTLLTVALYSREAWMIRTFYDGETCLLLAVPITSRGRWTSKRLLSHLGKKLLLPGLPH